MSTVLYITTQTLEQIPAETVRELDGREVAFLDLSDSGVETELPEGWQRLRAGEFFDPDAFRRDFLNFLEEWPKKPIYKGKSFDELFRRRNGYSVWWTGPAAARHPMRGIVPQLRSVWILDRVLAVRHFDCATIATDNNDLLSVLSSRCNTARLTLMRNSSVVSPPGPRPSFIHRVFTLLYYATRVTLKATLQIFSDCWRTFQRPRQRTCRTHPTQCFVFSSRAFRHVTSQNGTPQPLFWRSLSDAIRRKYPEYRQVYLIRCHRGLASSDAESLAELRLHRRSGRNELLQPEPFVGPLACLWLLMSQLQALYRLGRVEGSRTYWAAFRFAGADVSPLYAPLIRQTVHTLMRWEFRVVRYAHTLRALGQIAAILVGEEMYAAAMPELAAARLLRITTIGIQHGTIEPSHYVYTIPRGHAEAAPTPDFFAAYGEYAKHVVSNWGAYPPHRVWVTGPSRFDWIRRSADSSERARHNLAIPRDHIIVLLATQTYGWFGNAIRAVISAVQDADNVVVCIKRHPSPQGMSGDEIRAVARAMSARNVRVFEGHFEELLAACDVLVSASSTTLLEAMLREKDCVCLNLSNEPDAYPYATEGPALPGRSPKEVAESLRIILSGRYYSAKRRRRAFLQKHAGPAIDGGATAAFLTKLEMITGRQRAVHNCQMRRAERERNALLDNRMSVEK